MRRKRCLSDRLSPTTSVGARFIAQQKQCSQESVNFPSPLLSVTFAPFPPPSHPHFLDSCGKLESDMRAQLKDSVPPSHRQIFCLPATTFPAENIARAIRTHQATENKSISKKREPNRTICQPIYSPARSRFSAHRSHVNPPVVPAEGLAGIRRPRLTGPSSRVCDNNELAVVCHTLI